MSILHRWESTDGITVADGEAGRGVYAFFPSARAMSRYYQTARTGARLVILRVEGELIDLTRGNLHAQLLDYMRGQQAHLAHTMTAYRPGNLTQGWWRNGQWIEAWSAQHAPHCAGWIVPHRAHSLPPGKQVVLKPDRYELIA